MKTLSSVRWRVSAGLIALLVLMAALTVIGILRTAAVKVDLDHISQINSVRQRYYINFRGSVHDRAISVRDIIMHTDPAIVNAEHALVAKLEQDYADSAKPLDQQLATQASQRERELITDVKAIELETQPLIAQLLSACRDGDKPKARIAFDQARPKFSEWLKRINAAINHYESLNAARSADINRLLSGFTMLMVSLTAIAVAVGLVLVWLIRRQLAPIVRVQATAERLARGEPADPLGLDSNDEIGAVAQAMDRLIVASAQRSDLAGAVAHGDLRPEVILSSDHDRLGLALRDMVAGLRTRVSVLDRQAGSLASSSGEITDAANSLSQGATEQAASLEEIAATVTEIASSTQAAAEAAAQADARAAAARAAGEDGLNRLGELDQAMAGIQEATSSIAGILKSIDAIAFQTNLLALNAAVEAARAGRHGKGFAVVADEVRALAGRSAKAAQESAQLIEQTGERVRRGLTAAGTVAESLKGIAGAVSQTAALVADIARSAQQQASALAQVREGVSQVENVTQANTAQAEQTAAAASELARTARELAELVGNFKMPEDLRAGQPKQIHAARPQALPAPAAAPRLAAPRSKPAAKPKQTPDRPRTPIAASKPVRTSPAPKAAPAGQGWPDVAPDADPASVIDLDRDPDRY